MGADPDVVTSASSSRPHPAQRVIDVRIWPVSERISPVNGIATADNDRSQVEQRTTFDAHPAERPEVSCRPPFNDQARCGWPGRSGMVVLVRRQ